MKRLSWDAKVGVWKRMGYQPTPIQATIHLSENLTDVISGGWRAGKSMVIAAETVPHCLIPSPRAYLIALIGPTYEEPRAEFDYIVDFLSAILPAHQFDREKNVSRPKEGRCELTIPSQRTADGEVHYATVRTFTAAEVERIRSFNADAVVMCEAGGISREGFYNILGRVLSTGGFVLGSGTLETSQKWYHNVIKTGRVLGNPTGIHSFIMPSWANIVVFEGGEDDPKIQRLKQILPDDYFQVRVAAQPIRMTGVAVKEASLDVNVSAEAEFEIAYPVELAVDPGYARAFSVLAIQIVEGERGIEIRVVDEVYQRYMGTPDIVQICKGREWWQNVDTSNPGVIDRAAKQHNAIGQDSVLDKWEELTGQFLDLTEAVIPVDDGLMTLRAYVKSGVLKIHPRCRGLLAEWDLGDFPEDMHDAEPWHYIADSEGRLKGDRALSGEDHSSTALIYWLVNRYGFVTPDTLQFGPAQVIHANDIFGRRRIVNGEDYGPAKYGAGSGTDILGRAVSIDG